MLQKSYKIQNGRNNINCELDFSSYNTYQNRQVLGTNTSKNIFKRYLKNETEKVFQSKRQREL